jgi:cytochrome o ubiquinol oxidase subunit 2
VIKKYWVLIIRFLCVAPLLLLSGCGMELFTPKGSIGEQEKTLIITALVLMLLVVIPVIILTLYFAWHYRASNPKARYSPTWAHSTKIEIVVWTIPCVIVVFLAVLIWHSTHALDPYRPIESDADPIRVEVVAMNWKWLFIYPDYGVASVNEMALPVDTPVAFKITAESMMNSFFIPQLGSQVYAMAGMQTRLHLIANTPGTYDGLSAAYSGPGFSDMHFNALARTRQGFDEWIQQARNSPLKLDQSTYRALVEPSTKNAVTVYSSVAPALFDGVVNQYMQAGMGHDMPAAPPHAMPAAMPPGMPMPHTHTQSAE